MNFQETCIFSHRLFHIPSKKTTANYKRKHRIELFCCRVHLLSFCLEKTILWTFCNAEKRKRGGSGQEQTEFCQKFPTHKWNFSLHLASFCFLKKSCIFQRIKANTLFLCEWGRRKRYTETFYVRRYWSVFTGTFATKVLYQVTTTLPSTSPSTSSFKKECQGLASSLKIYNFLCITSSRFEGRTKLCPKFFFVCGLCRWCNCFRCYQTGNWRVS